MLPGSKQFSEETVETIVGKLKAMDTFIVYSHELAGEKEQTNHQLNDIFLKLLAEKIKVR